MAKTTVQIELSSAQEISLMQRYGRKCSPETLLKRALAEVLRQQAEDVPVFEGKEAYEARIKAEAEAKRVADAEASKLPPAVEELIARFKAGEKFVDLEGREVSAVTPNEDEDLKRQLPILIQVGGDNSEWYAIGLDGLQPEAVCICGHDGKLVSTDCRVHGTVIDREFAEIPDAPDAPPNLDVESAAREDFNA